jgi:acyl carrier protein
VLGSLCGQGKVDIYANAKVGLMALRKNLAFHAIDMDRMAVDDVALTTQITREVFTRLAKGEYQPIPYTTFPMQQIKEALTLMRGGKHIGKVLLVNYEQGSDGVPRPVSVRVQPPHQIWKPEGWYIFTGGLGGFGGRLLQQAYHKGARNFIITVTRNPERAQRLHSNILADPTARLEVMVADTGKRDDMARVVAMAHESGRPLTGVIHCAGISNDIVVRDLQEGDYDALAACKAGGGWFLHDLTKDIPTVETFVVIGSCASHLSGRGTATYAAANAYLGGLIRYRRSLGLPGTAFDMASLTDTGILLNDYKVRQFQLKSGVEMMHSVRAIRELEESITAGLPLGAQLFYGAGLSPAICSNMSSFFHGILDSFTLGETGGGIKRLTPKQTFALIVDLVKAATSCNDVLGPSQLASVGIDSLSMVELLSRIRQSCGVDVSPSRLTMTTTVDELARMVIALQSTASDVAAEEAADVAEAEGEGREQAKQTEGVLLPANSAAMKAMRLNRGSAFEGSDESSSEGSDEKTSFRERLCEWNPGEPTRCCFANPDHLASCAASVLTTLKQRKKGSASSLSSRFLPWLTRVTRPIRLCQIRNLCKASRPDFDWASLTREPTPADLIEARRWFVSLGRPARCKHRLLILPCAGGTAATFANWIIKDTETLLVQIPGRDRYGLASPSDNTRHLLPHSPLAVACSRADEPPNGNIYELGRMLARAIAILNFADDVPFTLMGHSWGTYVALETSLLLKQCFDVSPAKLVAMAVNAPSVRPSSFES